MKIGELTVRQKAFADYSIESGNATQAAIKAGYSEKTATEMGAENLRKPHIKAYIDERLTELESDSIATSRELMERLTSILRGEVMDPELRYVSPGVQEAIEIPARIQQRIKAAELLARIHGLFTNRVEMSGNLSVTVEYDYGDEGCNLQNGTALHKKRSDMMAAKKRSGNPNPKNQFTKGNRAAVKHGFYCKIVHPEQLEIMEMLDGVDVVDMLWFLIVLQYTAIIRMQKIMWVQDSNDHIEVQDCGKTHIAFAHERCALYLYTQSTAMATLRKLIEQYQCLTYGDVARRLKVENMAADIEIKQEELKRIRNDRGDDYSEIVKAFNEATAPAMPCYDISV